MLGQRAVDQDEDAGEGQRGAEAGERGSDRLDAQNRTPIVGSAS